MGGGMFNAHSTKPRILAGCHETQLNTKANDGTVDPWMYALVSLIKKLVKCGVPTYTVLYSEAKESMKQRVDGGHFGPLYKWHSKNETNPWTWRSFCIHLLR
jgi:hypothetical protein